MNATCCICGKAGPVKYPNWITGKDIPGDGAHVGCLASQWAELREVSAFLLDRHIASGSYGPCSDDWAGSFCDRHWGEMDLWRKPELTQTRSK